MAPSCWYTLSTANCKLVLCVRGNCDSKQEDSLKLSESDAFHSNRSYFRAPVCEKQSRADIPRSLDASFNFQLRSRPGRCRTTGCPQAPPILASLNMKTSAELCPNDASDNGTGPACRQPVVYTWCRVLGERVFTQRRPEEATGRSSVGGNTTFAPSSSLRLYLEQ